MLASVIVAIWIGSPDELATPIFMMVFITMWWCGISKKATANYY
jgi:hypothetical protein